VFLYLTAPQIYTLLVYDFFSFFGQAAVTNTVQEARGWAADMAWLTFNYGLILMIGGILVMAYKNTRDEHPEQVFALVWSLIMLFSTIQHVRYEYYLAINIALLSAACVSFVVDRGWADLLKLVKGVQPVESSLKGEKVPAESEPTAKKSRKSQKKNTAAVVTNYPLVAVVVIVLGLSLLFVYTSASLSYNNAHSDVYQMNPDWKESLEWMGNNTPDTGVNYYKIYDKNTFRYPDGSYGVMSWWDYGHMITYIAKRIPNANPFQQGVAGDVGAAAYFMSTSEDTANAMMDQLGTRYVITDIEMDGGKFWAMSTWYNATAAAAPYQMNVIIPGKDDPASYEAATLNKQNYYLTTISRLHNFDGSLTYPTNVYYVEYADPEITKVSLPVITNAVVMNSSAAHHAADAANLKASKGYHAAVLSSSFVAPVDTVPALRHYRLVHESPTNVFNSKAVDVKYVKTFEYVKGAHIKGEGIIEVPVVSNTGRNFTYRQESINGEFIVPYSTTGNPYDVKTTGKYTIIGTGRHIDVPESAVMQGSTVQ
jgi:dolichyl-diphosphooligosaccharide--protein glycosyltransferase